jgi:hypothetical protein
VRACKPRGTPAAVTSTRARKPRCRLSAGSAPCSRRRRTTAARSGSGLSTVTRYVSLAFLRCLHHQRRMEVVRARRGEGANELGIPLRVSVTEFLTCWIDAYSARRASAGSTRPARRAGTYAAAKLTSNRVTALIPNARKSPALMPKERHAGTSAALATWPHWPKLPPFPRTADRQNQPHSRRT